MKMLMILVLLIVAAFLAKTLYSGYSKANDGVEAIYGDNGIYGCVQRKIEADRMPSSTPQEREAIETFMKGCEKLSN